MRRIKDGFRLVGQSWQVVRREPALIAVMALGMVVTILTAAAFYFLAYRRMPEAADFRWPGILWLYPILVVSGIPGTVATGTVIATAMRRIEGRDVSIREGLSLTLSRLPRLVLWSIIAGLVGIFIQLIAERLKLGGRITAFLAGVTWVVATMLVIPVILFEDKGPLESIGRSAQLIKKRWGEGVTGLGSINVALMLLMIPAMLLATGLFFVDVALGAVALATVFLATVFLTSALGGVFSAALYRFATAGTAGGPFTAPQLESTFVTKEERKRPARRAWTVVGFVFLGIYLLVKLLEWTDVISISDR